MKERVATMSSDRCCRTSDATVACSIEPRGFLVLTTVVGEDVSKVYFILCRVKQETQHRCSQGIAGLFGRQEVDGVSSSHLPWA